MDDAQKPLHPNKSTIVNALLAKFPNTSERHRYRMLNAVLDIMGSLLGAGLPITLSRFGTFTIQELKYKHFRNPYKNCPLEEGPPVRRVKFKTAPSLHKRINPRRHRPDYRYPGY